MLTAIVEQLQSAYQNLSAELKEINFGYAETREIVQRIRSYRKRIEQDQDVARFLIIGLLLTHAFEKEESESYKAGAELYLALHQRHDAFLEKVKKEMRR
ncbi:hypothetical protein HY484_01885 [Candidatus Woesearchaeota archaeon]|nr:hypothetical protein [Candidatus Woesearchaeota archaeon]